VAPPILVTGSHRSGTTWAGRILALDPRIVYVHEPFNLDARRPAIRVRPEHWFEHVTRENEAALLGPMTEVVRGEFPPRKRSIARRVIELAQPPRVLLKDPIALLAAPWLADRFASQVLVMIRHPAAFASSLKRLDWRFDFGNLAAQPLFMRDLAGRHASEIRSFAEREHPIIDQAVLLWNVLHRVIAGYRDEHPDWTFLRLEDLSDDPIEHFRSLYRQFGLRWTPEVEAAAAAASSEDAPAEVAPEDRNVTIRNSREARWSWRQRLTPEEQARVREATREVAEAFYDMIDWLPPETA